MKESCDFKGDFTGFGHRDLWVIIAVYRNRGYWRLQVGAGGIQAMGLDILSLQH